MIEVAIADREVHVTCDDGRFLVLRNNPITGKGFATDSDADNFYREVVEPSIEQWLQRPPSTSDLIEAKTAEVRHIAEQYFTAEVTTSDGKVWRGGKASAESIKGAVELAQFAGMTEITLRDANREPHVMALETAMGVAVAIAMDYQMKFQAEEDALLALSRIDLSSEDAIQQIEAVELVV
jgi:hypothetical protein